MNIAVRTLQGYEAKDYDNPADRLCPVPNDVVHKMVDLYKTPLLVWWHFRYGTDLGREYMPDIQLPQTHGDAGFLTVLGNDNATNAQAIFRAVMADGRIDPEEHEALRRFGCSAGLAADQLLSAKVYVDTYLAQTEGRGTG